MKTTVRLTVILPDNYGRIQRLHDNGIHFTLEEKVITGADNIANFIERLRAAGGKQIALNHFIDDDDFQKKICVRYEYIA